jgi:NADPH:quinone reductase-like Zn-dependent oxidoreductase
LPCRPPEVRRARRGSQTTRTSRPKRDSGQQLKAPRQDDLQVLREFLEAGKLTPRIGRTYPLGEVPEAMRALEAGKTRGKIVITV